MTARDYVAERGWAVGDWLTSFIEQQFGRVVEGAARAYSEYGVVYEEHRADLDAQTGHAAMMESLLTVTERSLPPGDRKTMTLVWRKKPEVYARTTDFERSEDYPNTVRVRYRMHTMAGLDNQPKPDPDADGDPSWAPPRQG